MLPDPAQTIMNQSNAFLFPSPKLSVLPFWFWNDTLDEAEILRQIGDFAAHGVHGFVIHPRIGLPAELAFMSARLLHFYQIAIDEAKRRGMQVVLYDEGMYPSGSAGGQVVAQNPAFACRCLDFRLAKNAATPPLLDADENLVALVPRQNGAWIAVIDRPAGSVARGLHYIGEGPAEQLVACADILNPAAVACFIELVHERFASHFGAEFGHTIRAIFTDEPSLLGKHKSPHIMPGTTDIFQHVNKILGYDFTPHLPALWFDDEADAAHYRQQYLQALETRLQQTYYGPIYQWCKRHGLGLTGHPYRPNDLAVQRFFAIPGQDLVWRRVLPDHASALEGPESTTVKCTSSAMQHWERRFNSLELFGAYGHELTWDEMCWLTLWAFVRGVNRLYPHAFYYSMRGVRQNERPPDVGPHASWWPRYPEYALACRRLSWLNTDSSHVCDIAILGHANGVPWQAAKVCYQAQRDFNYLDETELLQCAVIDAHTIVQGRGRYQVLIVEQDLSPALQAALAPFGARVIRFDGDQLALLQALGHWLTPALTLTTPCPALRLRQVVKDQVRYSLLFNEVSAAQKIQASFAHAPQVLADRFCFSPFSGAINVWDGEVALALPGHGATVLMWQDQSCFAPPFGRKVGWLASPRLLLRLAAEDKLMPMTVCDCAYLDFAISLIRSTDLFSPGLPFLLHLINPTGSDISRLQALGATLKTTRLAVSYETIDLSSLDQDERRTYFACARFLRLAELLPLLGLPLLCLDADSLVVAALDFAKLGKAGLAVVQRDVTGPMAEQLAVLNSSIWLRHTTPVQNLIVAVASEIVQAFADGSASWYLDQVAMGRQIAKAGAQCGIVNLPARFADWNFLDTSSIWAAKGTRKYMDLRFSLLSKICSDKPWHQQQAVRQGSEIFAADLDQMQAFHARFMAAKALLPHRVALFLPRLDLPWKSQPTSGQVPQIGGDTLALRLHWKQFTALLANALERIGIAVDVIELPAWQLDAGYVDACGVDLALIPHRCKLDFKAGNTPVMFYMQEFFRWIFVLDRDGWGAAASAYPLQPDTMPEPTEAGAFARYRQRLLHGELGSKFAQPARLRRAELIASGQIPDAPYLFFPLQIPHDQVIRYFAPCSEQEVVENLAEWCHERGLALVFKPHPANLKSMEPFKALAAQHGAFWSDAHIHDLIAHATAVYTINSGVGFEALLHLKPVVTFGRVEYDCVSFQADAHTLDAAWDWVQAGTPETLVPRYGRFVDWFLAQYAIDLSASDGGRAKLAGVALEIAACLETREVPGR